MLFRSGGNANGHGHGKAAASILGRRNQISELQTALAGLQEEVAETSRHKGALQSEQTELQASLQQAQTEDLADRRRLFTEVQRIFADEMPAIYLVAPKVTIAISSRVVNPQPAPLQPQLLWSADTLAATPSPR